MQVKIYYLRDIKTNTNIYLSLQFDENYKVKLNMIDNYYYCIYEYVADNKETFLILDDIFELFNSDNNPLSNPGIQGIIFQYKLHTSMSIGDIIKLNDEYYVVRSSGFMKIED